MKYVRVRIRGRAIELTAGGREVRRKWREREVPRNANVVAGTDLIAEAAGVIRYGDALTRGLDLNLDGPAPCPTGDEEAIGGLRVPLRKEIHVHDGERPL